MIHPEHKRARYFFSVFLLLLQVAPARAQGSQNNKKLKVLIDKGRIDRAVGAVNKRTTSSANSTIKAQRFRHGLLNLPEILEQEVGVQVRSSGGAGSLSTVVLRGASAQQVMIYLDGVPLNDASGSPVDLSLIPVSSIERIDIYRGSTPLELGNPSIGGAINIITRQSSVSPSSMVQANSNVNISTGSFHTYKIGASSKLRTRQDDYLFSTSYLQSKNDFRFVNNNGTPLNPNDDRVEKRKNDGVKQRALLANWKHKVNQKYDTEVRMDLSDRHKALPSVTNNADVQTYLDTLQYHLLGQLNARSVWLKNLSFNAKLFASRKNEIFDDSLAQLGFINQRTVSVTRKAGTQIYAQLNQQYSSWKLLNSLSLETYDHSSTQALVSSDTNSRKRLALSVENNRYFDNNQLIVNLVLRYQLIVDAVAATTDAFANVTPGFNINRQLVNPQLGVKYRFTQHTYLTANIGQYSRVPSFLELFGGDGLLLGNVNLKQETALNTDMGFTYTWYKPYHWLHHARFYSGVFYNRIQNLIVRIYNGQGLGKSENIADAQVRGFETTLKLMPAKHHTLHINLTLLDSINYSDITSFQGKSLPGYYQQSLGLRYAYQINHWLYRFEVDIKRNLFYDRSNLLKGDNVNLINLGLRYSLQKSSIDFKVNNLLNENIRYFRNRPTPGLNMSLTYNHLF